MIRHFYITEDLEEISKVEEDLILQGFTAPQFHVLSENDAEVKKHDLHEVESVLKQDVVHSTEVGALIGIVAATLTLLVAYSLGWTNSAAGWMPFIFLAIVILGFCTWEGGFIGIQTPNVNFEKFHELLQRGKHVFFVDVAHNQEQAIERVMAFHPNLQTAGLGDATPHWVVRSQNGFHRFMKTMP